MKEIMYSGIDTHDGTPSLMWVRGDIMTITTDYGDDDPWRDQYHPKCQVFGDYLPDPHDPSRFTDLMMVWERDV